MYDLQKIYRKAAIYNVSIWFSRADLLSFAQERWVPYNYGKSPIEIVISASLNWTSHLHSLRERLLNDEKIWHCLILETAFSYLIKMTYWWLQCSVKQPTPLNILGQTASLFPLHSLHGVWYTLVLVPCPTVWYLMSSVLSMHFLTVQGKDYKMQTRIFI